MKVIVPSALGQIKNNSINEIDISKMTDEQVETLIALNDNPEPSLFLVYGSNLNLPPVSLKNEGLRKDAITKILSRSGIKYTKNFYEKAEAVIGKIKTKTLTSGRTYSPLEDLQKVENYELLKIFTRNIASRKGTQKFGNQKLTDLRALLKESKDELEGKKTKQPNIMEMLKKTTVEEEPAKEPAKEKTEDFTMYYEDFYKRKEPELEKKAKKALKKLDKKFEKGDITLDEYKVKKETIQNRLDKIEDLRKAYFKYVEDNNEKTEDELFREYGARAVEESLKIAELEKQEKPELYQELYKEFTEPDYVKEDYDTLKKTLEDLRQDFQLSQNEATDAKNVLKEIEELERNGGYVSKEEKQEVMNKLILAEEEAKNFKNIIKIKDIVLKVYNYKNSSSDVPFQLTEEEQIIADKVFNGKKFIYSPDSLDILAPLAEKIISDGLKKFDKTEVVNEGRVRFEKIRKSNKNLSDLQILQMIEEQDQDQEQVEQDQDPEQDPEQVEQDPEQVSEQTELASVQEDLSKLGKQVISIPDTRTVPKYHLAVLREIFNWNQGPIDWDIPLERNIMSSGMTKQDIKFGIESLIKEYGHKLLIKKMSDDDIIEYLEIRQMQFSYERGFHIGNRSKQALIKVDDLNKLLGNQTGQSPNTTPLDQVEQELSKTTNAELRPLPSITENKPNPFKNIFGLLENRKPYQLLESDEE